MGHIPPCGVGVWADMEDYKGHRCSCSLPHTVVLGSVLHRAVEHHGELQDKPQRGVGCLLLGKRGQGQKISKVPVVAAMDGGPSAEV